MIWTLKLLALGGVIGGLAASTGLSDRETRMRATCLPGHERVRLTIKNYLAWQETVKEANLAASQVRGELVAPDTIHLTFANGGWIRFVPDRAAIADGSLPPLVGMHFGKDLHHEASQCTS